MGAKGAREKIKGGPEARRRHVMGAARRLFLAHGFHATGIAQIAKDAGVHVVQIYRDFGSKEDIIAAIAEDEVRASMEEATCAASGIGGVQGFRRWIRGHIDRQLHSDEPDLFLEIVAEASRNPRIAAVFQKVDSHARKALAEVFARLAPASVTAGELETQVELFITLTAGLYARMVAHPHLDKRSFVARIEAILEREIFGPSARTE
ncbi:TetR/AcrR family transcriptional regulator [Novosphingobium sp.]|uniref:TetR/AcrR family transcriptional regulator n=1 Tax=Novosphingobium sp. TaxID=1874826 RepID=UPI002FE10C38